MLKVNYRFDKRLSGVVPAVFIILLAGMSLDAAPVVSDNLRLSVPGGGALTDLFTFPMPAPCDPAPCTENRVMMAKFAVNETVNDLSFELRSATSPVAKYSVTGFSTAGGGPNVSIMDADAGVEAAVVRARFTAETAGAGYRILTILVRFNNDYEGFPGGETWKISAASTATTDLYFGFRVDHVLESAAEALITKPYLIAYINDAQIPTGPYTALGTTYSINFGEVHINLGDTYLPSENWEFRNIGTARLEITVVTPFPLPAGAFSIENYPSPPQSVLPMNGFQRTVKCKPTALGPITDPGISLTTNAGNYHLNLAGARGIELRSALLMDLSGSMVTDKAGNWNKPAEEQKIYNARIAALELAELYNGILPKGKLGLYSYPATEDAYACPSSQQHINLSIIETNIQAYRNHLNTNLGHSDLIVAIEGQETPMTEGISRVWSVLYPKPDNSRAAVFMFGDGQHSYECNSAGSRPTPADWYNWNTFQNAHIPFFTIPYGVTNETWMTTFENIADRSGGVKFAADITDDGELQTQFKKALGKVLDLETLKDPSAHIINGRDTVHEICISSSAYQLVFSVHWTIKDPNALDVTVETPYHTILTPATTPSHGSNATYIAGETYKNYIVRGKFFKADSGVGVWKVRLHARKSTDYVYQIYAMDRMKSASGITFDHIGVAGLLAIKFAPGNYAVSSANVLATIHSPTVSYQNYLANTPVTPEEIARIPDSLAREWGPAEKKLYALSYFQKNPFNPKMKIEKKEFGELTSEIAAKLAEYKKNIPRDNRPERLREGIGTGLNSALLDSIKTTGMKRVEYQLPLAAALVDGYYHVTVSVIGVNSKAECFEREYSLSTIVSVLLNSASLAKAILWEHAVEKPFFTPELKKLLATPIPEGKIRRLVTIVPEDSMGNKFGMGRQNEIRLSVSDAEVIGPMADNYDGSYSQLIQFSNNVNPKVSMSIDGVEGAVVPFKAVTAPPVNPWLLLLLVIVIVIFLLVKSRKKSR